MNENLQPLALRSDDWLNDATERLKAVGIASARLDAELILSHTVRKPRTFLHAHPDTFLTDRQREIADSRLLLRTDFVPIAYIIGHKEFYGRPFHVTNATLIPRPESEDMIHLLDDATRGIDNKPLRLVDVGTGSGVLGITAKLQLPDWDVTLIDNSRHALQVAEKNAAEHHADVTLLHSDLLESYPFKADIIIANLPYVDTSWERSRETDHEPSEALFASKGGLHLILRLLQQTRSVLSSGGALILEADPRQHEAIKKAAAAVGIVHEKTQGFAVLLRKVV